jgi:hypothetical protein
MDMSTGLIAANAPISDNNGVKAFGDAATTATNLQTQQLANTQTAYQQNLTARLQKAIQESIGDNGMPDPAKLRVAGAKYNISAQTIDYTIAQMPKVWAAAQAINKSKVGIQATNPEGEKSLTQSWANQPAGKAAVQSSSQTPAVPTQTQTPAAAPQGQQPQTDITGFTTPDMTQTPSGYTTAGNTVSGEGQTASDVGLGTNPSALEGAQTPDQQAQAANIAVQDDQANANFFGRANAMEPSLDTENSGTASTANPIQLAGMDAKTQAKMIASLKQASLLSKNGTLVDAQAALDKDFQRAKAAVGIEPTKNMFVDQDGNVDLVAFHRAQMEYSAKFGKTVEDFTQRYGKVYGDQLAQSLSLQSNSRANQANNRANTDFGQAQDTIAQYRNKGYTAVSSSNLPEVMRVDQEVASTKGVIQSVHNLTKEIQSGKLKDPGAINAEWESIQNRWAAADGVNTVSGLSGLAGALGVPMSIRQQWAQHGGFNTEGLGQFATAYITKNGPRQFAKLLEKSIHTTETTGKAISEAQNLGNADPYGTGGTKSAPWSKQPAGKKTAGAAKPVRRKATLADF